MTAPNEHPHEALERIFHEPGRLAIMSTACAAEKGVTFSELKTACNLTGGNLNRHLKVLQDAGVIRMKKTFVRERPQTTITITTRGLDRFTEYLACLSDVLVAARDALPAKKRKPAFPFRKTARA